MAMEYVYVLYRHEFDDLENIEANAKSIYNEGVFSSRRAVECFLKDYPHDDFYLSYNSQVYPKWTVEKKELKGDKK